MCRNTSGHFGKRKEKCVIGLNLDILEDKEGNLTISDVSGQKWSKKFKKAILFHQTLVARNQPFGQDFKVRNLDPSTKWILSNSFIGQDYFDFFKKRKDGWKHIESGDMVEFSNREFKMRAFHFYSKSRKRNNLFYKN